MAKETKIAQRKIIALDIENTCGKSIVTEDDVKNEKDKLASMANIQTEDLIIIGKSHNHNLLAAKYAWPGALHVFHSGSSGAEIAIIDAIRKMVRWNAGIDEVVIVSGDGIFTNIAKDLRRLGIRVTVLSGIDRLSTRLAKSVDRIQLFPA